MVDTNLIILIALWSIIAIHTFYNLYITVKYNKRETKAVILSRDLDDKLVKINPNETDFNYKKKKYSISDKEKSFIAIGRKKYAFYNENNPEPINLYKEKDCLMNADVLYSISESNALKLLNSHNAFAGLNIGKIILYGGIALIIVFLVL